MKLDYLNNENSQFKAACGFIFGGSATIGILNAGYNVDRVLEMTDDMAELNAYHFVRNFSIPLVKPSEWENDNYLSEIKANKYNLMMFNPPCSSLSAINRNASADGKNNVHFYRVYNIINKVEPDTFLIENAPTLIKLGYPILKDLTHILGHKYRFTIVRDYASNHNVAMRRMRTFVIGWHRDRFDKIPLLHADIQPQYTLKDCIGDLYDAPLDPSYNHVTLIEKQLTKYENLFHLVPQGNSALKSFIKHFDTIKHQLDDKDVKYIERIMETMKKKDNIWDKTPYRPLENGYAPSMTSVTQIIHPVNNRNFTIREYARLMNYPDDFILHEGCKVPVIQCLAQGVPANFIKYIAGEIKEALQGNREFIEDSEDKILNFQHHTKMTYETFSQEQIDELTELDSTANSSKLEQ